MIALYRKGNTHSVRGIECEVGRFRNNEADVLVSMGWKKSPEDLVEKPLANEEIRQLAKAKGIEDADKARIGTLKQKLEDVKS